MARRLPSLLFLLFSPLLLFLLLPSSTAAPAIAPPGCAAREFSKNRLYSLCSDLPVLGSTLYWTHNAASSTLRMAFSSAPPAPGGWVSWGVNPAGPTMLGTQTLLAFRGAGGAMDVGTYNVSSYDLRKSEIAYEVSELEAEYGADGRVTIFAAMKLPAGTTKVNQVWQVGASVTNGVPGKHGFAPANMASKGTLDLISGGTSVSTGSDPRLRKRNIHGVLNAVSWGVLLPLGAVMARYLKTFKSADPAWFYLHVSCQLAGYVVGVAGGGTGLYLGNKSKGVQYATHRYMGIALFCLATLQVFALFLRPNKEHKYRVYWNAYHHAVGYVVITLGIINVFKGFSILNPAKKWMVAYILVIAVLGAIAVFLEVVTWVIQGKRKSEGRTQSSVQGTTLPV